MIAKIKFNRDVRDLFHKGQSLEIRPLTLLVGDNGVGKSTLLGCLRDSVNRDPLHDDWPFGSSPKAPVLALSSKGKSLERFLFADFERDNRRVQGDFDRMGPFGMFSVMSMSHGESVMEEIEHGFSELKSYLVLLDEPDQCLSPRSAYRMFSSLKRMVEENGCQVICSCHSVPLMESAGEVLSLEHGRWMTAREFLDSQREPKPLRWVDKDERYCDFAVKATLSTLSTLKEEYFSRSTGFGPPFTDELGRAEIYKTRERAQKVADSLAGREFSSREMSERKKVRVLSAEVVMVERSF